MLVEDDPLLTVVEEKLVTKLGYEVAGKAQSGEDALELLSVIEPDIIMMDIQLAGELDGIETTRKLRDLNFDMPVIFLSGEDDKDIQQRSRDVGGTDFLLKPVTSSSLKGPLSKAAAESQANFAA